MHLNAKIQNPLESVILYELIPPKVGDANELREQIDLIRNLTGKIDGINIPEIREETRQGVQRAKLPERIEPRLFAREVATQAGIESVINRVTVHDAVPEQTGWIQQTYEDYGIRSLILVGGESRDLTYPGPNVAETASIAKELYDDLLLGGISIPSRSQEAARIRKKYESGLRFFTTQVLLDSNDIVDLIRGLNGLDVRIVLSFAPISNAKDIEFLRWLGVDVPENVAWSLTQEANAEKSVEKSVANAAKILTDVFDNLPPNPPAIGLNIEQITRRNLEPAQKMLDILGAFYGRMMQSQKSAASSTNDRNAASR